MDLVAKNDDDTTLTVRERTPSLAWTDDTALPSKIQEVLPNLADRIAMAVPGTHMLVRCHVTPGNVRMESWA